MRPFVRSILLAASVAFCALPVHAAPLGPGSVAPALSVKRWYRGAPITRLAPNRTYVVEFWATWCGPCRESIPHLTGLARTYKDVTFIGVSIWEDDTGTKIKDFVRRMGSKMDYHVGYSGNQEGMGKTWMQAAALRGIPTAFVIRNGKILWIGHPMELDGPLGKIRSGTFDAAAFKARFDKQVAEQQFAVLTESKITTILTEIRTDRLDSAKRHLAAFEKQYPGEAGRLAGAKLMLALKEEPNTVDARLKQMAASRDRNTVQTLINLALDQTRAGGDTVLGDRIMGLLIEHADRDDAMRYYFGAVYALKRGDKKRAVALADRALAASPSTDAAIKGACLELKKEAATGG